MATSKCGSFVNARFLFFFSVLRTRASTRPTSHSTRRAVQRRTSQVLRGWRRLRSLEVFHQRSRCPTALASSSRGVSRWHARPSPTTTGACPVRAPCMNRPSAPPVSSKFLYAMRHDEALCVYICHEVSPQLEEMAGSRRAKEIHKLHYLHPNCSHL